MNHQHPIAEIFSQGDEVVTGQIVDTNAAWLSEQLVQMGFLVSRHTAVGDKLQDLIDLLQEISTRADFCISTGGLGPTIDDLTAEAVAQAFDSRLKLDPDALITIERYFSSRNRSMVDSNRKQALLPEDSIRLDNAWGTAPGFALQHNRCWFAFVPGVPSEMKQMFTEQIKEKLEKRFVLQPDRLIIIKTIGIGESELQQILNSFSLPENVQLSFRATPSEVQTKLLFPVETPEILINNCVSQLVESIGDTVIAVDELNKSNTELIDVVDQLMTTHKYTLSIIETLTHGLISAKCVGQEWLLASYYKLSNVQWGDSLSGNNKDSIEKAAIEIANQFKDKPCSDLLLVQLHEGDQKAFHDKEKSIVLYNVLITPDQIVQKTFTVTGSIERKQNQAAIRALDFLRKILQTNAINTTK